MDRDSIGSLIVAEHAADLDGAPGEVLTGADLQAAEPQLADDLAGGYLIEARRIDPAAATMAWADEARSYGSDDPRRLRGARPAAPGRQRRRRHHRPGAAAGALRP